MSLIPDLPSEIQERITRACRKRQITDTVAEEWFLGLDATGHITVRTPCQQKQIKPSNGHQALSGEKMLQPHKNSFHPDRGIG
jgi:hypothetical protein